MKIYISNTEVVFQIKKQLPSWSLKYATPLSGMDQNVNKQSVNIPQGSRYSFLMTGTGIEQGWQIKAYGFYADGTNELLYMMPIGTYMNNLTANKNIVAIGLQVPSGHITTDSGEVTLDVKQLN